jgi:dolichol-phosphate mannosyltransferase
MSAGTSARARVELSIVSPAYNEAGNLAALHARLAAVMAAAGLDWEWIVVDDHSADDSFAIVAELARRDPHVRGLRLARNAGSHLAIACGLEHARGEAVAVLAADQQDPPEILPLLVARWREGAQVVWAARELRDDASLARRLAARGFYAAMRRCAGLDTLPPAGADCVLLDRVAVDALRSCAERNVNLFALIAWLGFRQAIVTYAKEERGAGRSGWTAMKQMKLLVDSITSFSYLPLRLAAVTGVATALAGFVYAGVVVVNALAGNPVEGWSSLMVVLLLVGGVQMVMLGVLGEYLWRALDEARRRPRYVVEASVGETPSTR